MVLHIEKTIPLENIQDISFIGGPILRAFGLSMVKVETAGGGGANHSNQMSMVGMDEAENFKMLILDQREKRMREKNQVNISNNSNPENSIAAEKILTEIKNELVEIKNLLREKK